MKIAIPLLVLFIISLSLNGQWQSLNPQPASYSCTKIIFADSQNGFILNSNSDLLSTTDQGKKWQLAQHFSNAQAIDMKDSIGVIAGNNTLYLTNDKGRSWKTIAVPAPGSFTLLSVLNRNTFIIGTGAAVIYRTDDGGTTWKIYNIGDLTFALQFVSSQIGYASGPQGALRKTTDGGISWTKVLPLTTAQTTIYAFQFLDTNRGYVYRGRDSILVTNDGGLHWNRSIAPIAMKSIYFIDSTIGYLAGSEGAIAKTNDAGNNWMDVIPKDSVYGGFTFNAVYFITRDTGFAIGLRGRIMKTNDGGTSWIPYSPVYRDLTSIAFPSAGTGYVTSGINIFKTSDSGYTWKALDFKAFNPLTGHSILDFCHFFNKDSGLVFETEPARICQTSDGGNTWSVANLPNDLNYNSSGYLLNLHFYNDSSAYAVFAWGNSSSYNLWQTTDRGAHWQLAASNTIAKKIFFLDEKNGFGATYQQMIKTNDGGKTWTAIYTTSYQGINSVWFTSPARGFAACDQGLLLQTLDSGKTWNNANVPVYTGDDYYKIKFYNQKTGYITAADPIYGGAVYKTSNGGDTWFKDTSFNAAVNAIALSPDSAVYIAGNNGIIVKGRTGIATVDSVSNTGNISADSLRIIQKGNCEVTVAASIRSVLKRADSVFFEYGIHGPENSVRANPFSVADTTLAVSATINNLLGDSAYVLRLKIYSGGNIVYPAITISFTPLSPDRPTISNNVSGDSLVASSASGNQWYLDGIAIAGANNQRYPARTSGTYTVDYTISNCKSGLSAAYHFTYTGVTDISRGNNSLLVYPNPVGDALLVSNKNNRRLLLQVTDMQGRMLLQSAFAYQLNEVNVHVLAPGSYIVYITDKSTHESFSRLITKK